MALLAVAVVVLLLLFLLFIRFYLLLKAATNCPFRGKQSFTVVIVAGSGNAASSSLKAINHHVGPKLQKS